ncbi:Uncharacterised protein [Mycobacteroides abscessus subsp. abscessus]|nr:Uncharacterised protein [Mycobacteroides abscessus subsp. abscessus]
MGFAQQYLAGPLAVAVAVRVQLVHGTHRADEPDIGLFVECRRIDICRDRDRGQVGDRLDLGSDGQLDDLGGADDIRSEQLAVGQYVVDQGGGVHDDVDGLGQALPGVGIQAKVGVADIAGQYFEVLVGQRPEVRQQLRVAGVEGFLEAAVGGLGILTADDGDQLAFCLVQALKPFQCQVVAQVAVGPGEQDGVWDPDGLRKRRCRMQGGLVDELIQGQVRGPDLRMPGAVHRLRGRPRPARIALFINKFRNTAEIVCGTDDDSDRYFDREDIAQQIREGQCGQRIAT